MSAVVAVIESRAHDLGGGFVVRRALPQLRARSVGPFVFFDHFGPFDVPPGGITDVRPHPHIGLATVTYLFEGSMLHRDSLGNEQTILPGAVNWMTAGRGIVHSERNPPAARAHGQHLHGLQTWVALPRDQEECAPGFVHLPADRVPQWEAAGVIARIIAGNAFGASSPLQTASPTLYFAAQLDGGASLSVPEDYPERAVYLISGEVDISGFRLRSGQLAVLAPGAAVRISAAVASVLVVLGGAPLDGPRFVWWNFVSSSRERIERAKSEWREQRMGSIAGDGEYIPLPDH